MAAETGRFTALDAVRVAEGQRQAAAELRRKIAADLRLSFGRFMKEQYDQEAVPDPILSTLFLAIGDQLAPVYEAAEEHLPAAVLDELVRGLEMPARLATPAQSVAQFSAHMRRERLSRLAQVSGRTAQGARVRFAPAHPVVASATRLVFAAAYEPGEGGRSGRLHTLPGAEVATGVALPIGSATLELERTPPSIYLAFRADDDAHLSGLGLFIDTVRPDSRTTRAIHNSPWQLLVSRDGHAVAQERSTLRARPLRGSVQELAWVVSAPEDPRPPEAEEEERIPHFPGFYTPMVWVFPDVPSDRRVLSATPDAISPVVGQLLPEGYRELLDQPCIWVRIPLGPEGAGVAGSVQRIVPHCVPIVNVELWNTERVGFDTMGRTVSFRPEGDAARHIVSVLEVTGSRGGRYLEAGTLSPDPDVGRYRVRSPLIELTPGRDGEDQDEYARLRLLVSDGEKGNDVGAGETLRGETSFSDPTLTITNLTRSRGGKAPPAYEDAKTQLAERLRTRDRVVTASDVEITARAFDPRIVSAFVEGVRAERVPGRGLRPVTSVRIRVNREQFEEPEADLPLLVVELESHLQARVAMGQTLRVRVAGHG